MVVAPTGALSLAMEYGQLTLADAAGWRTWTGAANQTAARTFIYHRQTSGAYTRPVAIFNHEAHSFPIDAGGSQNYFEQEGRFRVIFEADVNSAHNEQEAMDTFTNNLGATIIDVLGLAGRAGYLDIQGIDTGPAERTDRPEANTRGDFYRSVTTWTYNGSA